MSSIGPTLCEIRVDPPAIEVHADFEGRIQRSNFVAREATLSAGITVFMVRLAMLKHGLLPEVGCIQDCKQPSLLASLSVVGRATSSSRELELYRVLGGEAGKTFLIPPVDVLASDTEELQEAAAAEGVFLRTINGARLREMAASMLEEGDRIDFKCVGDCKRFRSWLGLSVNASIREVGRPPHLAVWEVSREEARGARRDHEVSEGDALAVLCTNYDDQQSWLNTGQALAKVRLVAETLGLAVSVFNEPLDVPGVRPLFAREAGFSCFPQAMIRIARNTSSAKSATDLETGCSRPCESRN